MKDFSQFDPNKVAMGIAVMAAMIGWLGIFEPRFAFFILGALGTAMIIMRWLT